MPTKKAKKSRKATTKLAAPSSPYPRYSLERCLRIPKSILEQNAGKACSDQESARFSGVKFTGPYRMELSSAIKFGLLHRPVAKQVELTAIARKILKPQEKHDVIEGFREAILSEPIISDVYTHYRGENLPDSQFLDNSLTEKFKIPSEKVKDFKAILFDSLRTAELMIEIDGKYRLVDISEGTSMHGKAEKSFKKLEKDTNVKEGETCFVMMPFADPLGAYYDQVYAPAIEKAGLTPVRADDEIFGTGKIMEQVWSGISSSKMLIAELTSRNPNVFYELGMAHALKKPVVLVSSNEEDVPFDLQHIRGLSTMISMILSGGKNCWIRSQKMYFQQ